LRIAALAVVLALLALAAPAAQERTAGVMTFVDRDGNRKIVSVPATHSARTVPTGSADRRAELWPHVQQAALANGLDPELVDLVIRMESGYNPRAVSPKGARGVMQLLPSTARAYGVADIFNPKENIRGGIRYLRDLLGRFDSDVRLALAAYNAGPEAVEKHGNVPPYEETRNYVNAILSAYSGSGGQKLAGGFGKEMRPARPVEVVLRGSETTISNERRSGEPPVERRLALR
jgi:soluble lytic murein transglycosylase-like protein